MARGRMRVTLAMRVRTQRSGAVIAEAPTVPTVVARHVMTAAGSLDHDGRVQPLASAVREQ